MDTANMFSSTASAASPMLSPVATMRNRPTSPGALAQLTFRDIIVSIVEHPLFAVVTMSAVAANIASMAMQHAGVSDERTRLLHSIQLGTEIMFVVVSAQCHDVMVGLVAACVMLELVRLN